MADSSYLHEGSVSFERALAIRSQHRYSAPAIAAAEKLARLYAREARPTDQRWAAIQIEHLTAEVESLRRCVDSLNLMLADDE